MCTRILKKNINRVHLVQVQIFTNTSYWYWKDYLAMFVISKKNAGQILHPSSLVLLGKTVPSHLIISCNVARAYYPKSLSFSIFLIFHWFGVCFWIHDQRPLTLISIYQMGCTPIAGALRRAKSIYSGNEWPGFYFWFSTHSLWWQSRTSASPNICSLTWARGDAMQCLPQRVVFQDNSKITSSLLTTCCVLLNLKKKMQWRF